MWAHVYLKKVNKFQRDVYFLLQKCKEFQVSTNVLEQIENLSENCNAIINEKETLPNECRWWSLFEENLEDINLDFFYFKNAWRCQFSVKLLLLLNTILNPIDHIVREIITKYKYHN